MFADAGLADEATRFVTCLVRVPEAYALVRDHRAARPGLLVLDSAGRKRGCIALRPEDAAGSLAAAKEYLARARAADGPIEDVKPTAPDMTAAEGRFFLFKVGEGAPPEVKVGDVLVKVNGREVRRLGDLADALTLEETDVYEFERVTVRTAGPMAGIQWAFRPGKR